MNRRITKLDEIICIYHPNSVTVCIDFLNSFSYFLTQGRLFLSSSANPVNCKKYLLLTLKTGVLLEYLGMQNEAGHETLPLPPPSLTDGVAHLQLLQRSGSLALKWEDYIG